MEKPFNKIETPNTSIEVASIEDLSSIQELTKKLFEHEIKNNFDDNIDPRWSYSEEGEQELTERITSKDSTGLVYKKDNNVLGYLIGLIEEEETGRVDSRYANLEHMFVEETARKDGVGKKLVEEFKTWAKKNNLKRIKVNVSFENKNAIEFYKKVGLLPADITMVGEIE